MNTQHRCNDNAVWYSRSNGYKTCPNHVQQGMTLCAEAGPAPFGRCDHVSSESEFDGIDFSDDWFGNDRF